MPRKKKIEAEATEATEKKPAATGKFLTNACQHEMRVRMQFTESILGTSPGNPDIYRDYLGKKAMEAGAKMDPPVNMSGKIEEEVSTIVEDQLNKGKTVFSRDTDGTPMLWDYQIKGFFKSACQALKKADNSLSGNMRAFKKEIDQLIFIKERRIPIHNAGVVGECQRPLRSNGPQGERVSIAVSEEIQPGSYIDFTVMFMTKADMDYVREWLYYAQFNGVGQWRNGGHGRAVWSELDKDGNVIGGNAEV